MKDIISKDANFDLATKVYLKGETAVDIVNYNKPFTQTINSSIYINTMFLNSIMMRNINIIIDNGTIVFLNCTLYNLHIRDVYSAKNETLGHIQLTFTNSSIQCDDIMAHQWYGLHFQSMSTLKIVITKSVLYNCKFYMSPHNIFLIIVDSLLSITAFDIIAQIHVSFKVPSIIILSRNNFTQGKPNLQKKHISLVLQSSYVIIDNCNFKNISVDITGIIMNNKQGLFKVEVNQSSFVDSSKEGNGGALLISSQIKKSTINLWGTIFLRNKAMLGKGGAVYIEGSSTFLHIDSCIFKENIADDLGSSLFGSKGVDMEINNSTFAMDVSKSNTHSILSAFGKVHKLVGSKFEIQHQYPNLYNSDIRIFSIQHIWNDLIFSVQCPPWHRHDLQHQFVTSSSQMQTKNLSTPLMNNFIYECKVCMQGYHVASLRSSLIRYDFQSKGLQYYDKLYSENESHCLECPYGAICSGNNVIPRTNYWGFWNKDKLVFVQCPAEYCCSNTVNGPCEKFDSCAGNRTDILCGTCKKGFSVSILSGDCMPNSECGQDQWFWLLALLATVCYVLWFTFKDDLLPFFFLTFDGIKYIFCKFLKCRKNSFQPNVFLVGYQTTSMHSMHDANFAESTHL